MNFEGQKIEDFSMDFCGKAEPEKGKLGENSEVRSQDYER